MKLLILASAAALLAVAGNRCSEKQKPVRYKGRLEIKALCMNYTIRVIEGNTDTSLVNATWTNESNGKTYQHVFGLGSPCNFPPAIKEGDEFYFVIDSSAVQNCAVCMAFYPTPPKKLSIKVVQ